MARTRAQRRHLPADLLRIAVAGRPVSAEDAALLDEAVLQPQLRVRAIAVRDHLLGLDPRDRSGALASSAGGVSNRLTNARRQVQGGLPSTGRHH